MLCCVLKVAVILLSIAASYWFLREVAYLFAPWFIQQLIDNGAPRE